MNCEILQCCKWNFIGWVRKTEMWLKKPNVFCFAMSNRACETNTHVLNTEEHPQNVWSVSQMFGVACPQHPVLKSSDGAWSALKCGNVGCKWAEFISQVKTRSNLRVGHVKASQGCRCCYRCFTSLHERPRLRFFFQNDVLKLKAAPT